jgi:DNA polymerase elongation subunit (family B)
MTKSELLRRKAQLEKDIAKFSNMQLAKKVQLNSAYGALGNQWFRFYDIRQALAITKSGQLSIKWIEARINEYLNKLLETDKVDYVLASDTDSLYIVLDKLIEKFKPKNPIDFLDQVAQQKIEPFIDNAYLQLADLMNAYDQKMYMKREAIADIGIWTAKKRYMLNVYDNEGVRYDEPKLKMMGIEAIKSSTPQSCRDAMKKCFKLIMSGEQEVVQKYIADFKIEFFNLSFEDVAFPRGVSELNKYDSGEREQLELVKGTPIHVRGALVYNHLIRKHKLEKKYQTVKDGEKIKFCYMKEPNSMKQNVLSILNVLPTEFDVEKYIDYETQFNKSFSEPLQLILEKIGWSVEKRATLEDFFS